MLVVGPTVDLADATAVDSALVTVARNRAARDEALRSGQDPWRPWTQLYRNLRALGRWEEALIEAHAFVEFARKRDLQPDRYSMYYTGLFDLGNLYAALGDYDQAWVYHEQSLSVARDYQEWYMRTQGIGHYSSEYKHALTNALVPRLSALSALAAVRGSMGLAWDYHQQAGALLAAYFRQESTQHGLTTGPSVPLERLCVAAVARGDAEPSLVVKVPAGLPPDVRRPLLQRFGNLRNLRAGLRPLHSCMSRRTL